MNTNQRIKYFRTEISKNDKGKNYSQRQFAEKLGVSHGVINNIESNLVEAKDHIIKLISQTFDVNEDWLRNGTEPIFKEKENDALKEIFKQYGLSEFMQDIAIRYLNLDEKEQEAFEIFIKGMMKEIPEKNKPKAQYGMNYKTLIEEENKELEKNKRKVL